MIIIAFQESFQSIKTLVDDFKSNEKQYLNPNYSEADVRNDFINKFFIALGWDVRHETQKNPYEQEVRVEKPVLIAKAQKRADYTFYLSPNFRDVKFFVESKKPSHVKLFPIMLLKSLLTIYPSQWESMPSAKVKQ